ncbi:MAG TPA: addiction module protein [Burkholderiaceae bacterium]
MIARVEMPQSPENRARLAERLLDPLWEPASASIDAAWEEEIERRVAAFKRGEVESFDAEDVFAEARCIAP